VLRFIQALIDDVENEMNLEKEADNMKEAKRTNEEYSKHLTQETQIMTRHIQSLNQQQKKQKTMKQNQLHNLFHIPDVDEGKYDKNYIIMQRVNGTTLAMLLKKGSIAPIHYQCLENLARTYVGFIYFLNHDQYIFHADLHPGNIMFSTLPTTMTTTMTIIDWGFCCIKCTPISI
jgi:predicted unusual protein kinase regulating ubiquinone biosynthesis (AarF/ABC1/UbiB family)